MKKTTITNLLNPKIKGHTCWEKSYQKEKKNKKIELKKINIKRKNKKNNKKKI